MKICVAGVGGVGGFIAAALIEQYDSVTLLARGARAQALAENGLHIDSPLFETNVLRPAAVITQAEQAEVQDVIFICVKNNQLEAICRQLAPIAGPETVIVPIMNGADPADRVREYLPGRRVADSLIYIIAYTDKEYRLHHDSGYATLYVGARQPDSPEHRAAAMVCELFAPTKVDCRLSSDITADIWKKYILNCAYNIITTYYDATIGEIRGLPSGADDYHALAAEACLIATALHIPTPEHYADTLTDRFLHKLGDSDTSSLQRDVAAGREGELEVFSGYLLRQAEALGLSLPITEKFYRGIKERLAACARS